MATQMHTSTIGPLEQLSWDAFKNSPAGGSIASVSPLLDAALNDLFHETHDKPILWKGTYGYGELIVEDGQLRLPREIDNEVRRRFDNTFWKRRVAVRQAPRRCPLGLVLSKSVEVFLPQAIPETLKAKIPNIQTWPLQMISTGDVFGVFELLDRYTGLPPAPLDAYSISAGARSIQIATTGSYYRVLSGHASRQRAPARPTTESHSDPSHFKLICDYVTSRQIPWTTEILFFPPWLFESTTDPQSSELLSLLFRRGWIQSTHTRRSALHRASRAAAIVSHLENLRSGYLPAFLSSAPLNDVAGPFNQVRPLFTAAIQARRRDGLIHELVILQPWQLSNGQVGVYSFETPQPYLGGSNTTNNVAELTLDLVLMDLCGRDPAGYFACVHKASALREKVRAELAKGLAVSLSLDSQAAARRAAKLCRSNLTLADIAPRPPLGAGHPSEALCLNEGVFSNCILVKGDSNRLHPFARTAARSDDHNRTKGPAEPL
jgi:hypothetical protein